MKLFNSDTAQSISEWPLCLPRKPMRGRVNISDVTLVVVETMLHDLARAAMRDAMEYCNFGEVAWFSDKPSETSSTTWHKIEHDTGKGGVCLPMRYVWSRDFIDRISTPFFLYMQWDAGIIDPASWSHRFLEHDYIAPPWDFANGHNVGCGGFAIYSTRLMRHLIEQRQPMPGLGADKILCRDWRPDLEREGFTWAPDELAIRFGFEYFRDAIGPTRHFGYHDPRNWPLVMRGAALRERIKLAQQSKYIIDTGKLDRMLAMAPWLNTVIQKEKIYA